MIDLSTEYLGLKLDNPLVPSSSPMSRDLDQARRLEDAGAGALVMHSLFEEEVRYEQEQMLRFLDHQMIGHGEADSFLPEPVEYTAALDAYLQQLAALKRELSIPVIASLNGVSLDGWLEHGRELQQAGADALELNAYYIAADAAQSGAQVEQRYLDLLRELRQAVTLPITVKLGSQFSSLPNFIASLQAAGANGVSLFNRFYQPDIDLESLAVRPRLHYSDSSETLLRIRWVALLYGRVDLSLAVTGGFHTAEDALKALLAGSDVVHMCSALLQHGPEWLTQVKLAMAAWLEGHEYDSIRQLKGSVCQQHSRDPASYERANYINVLDSHTPPGGVRR